MPSSGNQYKYEVPFLSSQNIISKSLYCHSPNDITVIDVWEYKGILYSINNTSLGTGIFKFV